MISAQTASCTAELKCRAGQMAKVVLSAAAAKFASTTAWLPRLPQWQLSGTMRQTMVLLTVWWHKAASLLVGTVTLVATSGVPHPMPESANAKVAARSALES